MKVSSTTFAFAALACVSVAELREPRKAPPAQDKSISLNAHNLFARSYDYCSDNVSYCTDSICCGESSSSVVEKLAKHD